MSMIERGAHAHAHTGRSKNRKTRFSSQFSSGLARLVRFLFSDRAVQSLDALSNFPILLRKLFAVMDRGLVLNMVHDTRHCDDVLLTHSSRARRATHVSRCTSTCEE
jgi:hypothetical protein